MLFCGSGDRAGVHLVLAAVPREPDAVFGLGLQPSAVLHQSVLQPGVSGAVLHQRRCQSSAV